MINVKQNATRPRPRHTLESPPGTPLDLTGATVRFVMFDELGVVKVDAAATIEDAAAGLVHYDWQAGDVNTVATYRAHYEVTFPGNVLWTIPNNGYLYVNVQLAP